MPQRLDAAEQGGVALQSPPEFDGPDEIEPVARGLRNAAIAALYGPDVIDQFALGVSAAQAVLDGPRRESR